MNPIYAEFFKAFTMMLVQSQGLSLPESRAASTQFFTKDIVKEPIHRIIDKKISGPDQNLIPLRLFISSEDKDLPVLLFFHQGGWAFGSIEDADQICRKIANTAQCIVVAVDYRLSPENQFPKGLEDCYAATKWVKKNAKTFGGDAASIAVGGESCGANLAAAVALMSRDRGEFDLKFQLLLYPVISSDIDPKVYAKSMDQSFITIDAMNMFWSLYLRNLEDKNNPYASPIMAKSLEGVAPAFIVTAEHDPLHVEGEAYAKRLKEFNVPVSYKRYPGAVHCFLSLPIQELPERKEAFNDIKEAFSNLSKAKSWKL